MRQFIQIFLFDVRTSFTGFMGAYMLIAPLIILLILRFFLPTVESTSVTVAVVDQGRHAVDTEIVAELERYFDVVTYETIEGMEQKLRGTGSAEGLYRDPEAGQYVSVLERTVEGNTAFSAGARVIRRFQYHENYPSAEPVTAFRATVPPELSGRTQNSPVATMGGAIFVVFVGLISAFLIGLSVVNDKEYGTDRALQVTPVTRAEYYVGKSVLPLLVMLIFPGIAVLVLGLTGTNLLQVYVAVILSFSVTLFLGLVVGALGKNENEAIGILKTVGMVVMLGILGGSLLPDSWQWIVYWVPVYWLFDLLEGVFTVTATWTTLAWKTAIMVGSTAVYFLLLRKRIVAGLSY